MIRSLLITVFFSIASLCCAQVAPPYNSNFDTSADTVGWSHYALSGTDDWKKAAPVNSNFNSAYSAPLAYGTNLNSGYALNSNRALQTPYFNLAGPVTMLSFYQKRHSTTATINYFVEYCVGSVPNWQLLTSATPKKKNWQGASGFTGNFTSSFQYSAFSLDFLQGVDSVRFRFRFVSGSAYGEGWLLDNFSVIPEGLNVKAMPGDSVLHLSKYCNNITVKTTMNFNDTYGTFNNKTNYYLSNDTVLDGSDVYLASQVLNIGAGSFPWNKAVVTPATLTAGYHYILFKHDFNDSIPETNENDNVGICVIQIDSTYVLPYVEGFETVPVPPAWKVVKVVSTDSICWKRGSGFTHHLEGAHDGNNAWHTSQYVYTPYTGPLFEQMLESPYVDLTSATGPIYFNTWFKDQMSANSYKVECYYSCDLNNMNQLFTFPVNREDDWDFLNINLSSFTSYKNIKFRIHFVNSYQNLEGINIDDIYIGPAKPDLSIEKTKLNRYTDAAQSTDLLKYYLTNSGKAAAAGANTAFYWSTDSILDATDQFLGMKTEPSFTDTGRIWTTFSYTKPITAVGKYYIFYVLDSLNVLNEMREYNNRGYFVIRQQNELVIPYFNDFESQITGWYHDASLGKDEWKWTTPSKPVLNQAFSGVKAWITNDTGRISPLSRMHLYSPVFDLTTAVKPVLEFDMQMHSDDMCGCYIGEGRVNVSYSTDGGATWNVLDTTSQSYKKWYYPEDYDDMAGGDHIYNQPNVSALMMLSAERSFASYREYNGRDEQDNRNYILDIKNLAGLKNVQFRFNMASKNANAQHSVYGTMMDNFKITEAFTDLTVPYKKSLMISSASQIVRFNMHAKNVGNYLALPSVTKFYLSVDTVLDVSDYYLGADTSVSIRPDMNYYLSRSYNAPPGLPAYSYLLYELDATQLISESNESNNIHYWPLALDSVSSFPYLMNFEDTILNGWNSYAVNWDGTSYKNTWRFRNIIPPGENVGQTLKVSGQMSSDDMNSTIWAGHVAYRYLETPTFDFTNWDTIHLSFDLFCMGAVGSGSSSGGNFQYSTNGGIKWNTLDSLGTNSYHWYNKNTLFFLDGQAGWSYQSWTPNNGAVKLDSCFSDISFLKGNQSVQFRFKYRSNQEVNGAGYPSGMRVDNFRISAQPSGNTTPVNSGSGYFKLYASGTAVYISGGPSNAGAYTLNIYNTLGQTMMSQQITLNTNEISKIPLNLPNGVYVIMVYNERSVVSKKITLQN